MLMYVVMSSIFQQPVALCVGRHGTHAWEGLEGYVRVRGGVGVEATILYRKSPI